MGIYVNNETESWWGVAYAPDCGWFDQDLGLPVVQPSTWYRVQLDLDTVNGVMETRINDIKRDMELGSSLDVIPNWIPKCGQFAAVFFADGERTSKDVANVTVIDNI